MARFKTKAESSFETKLNGAKQARDWAEVEQIFYQFGVYLELIDAPASVKDEPVEAEQKT